MQGTWSIVFRGRKADLTRVLMGADALRNEPQYKLFCKALLKVKPNNCGDRQATLQVDGVWKNSILGLTKTLEALHQFALETEGACRTIHANSFEEYCYADYIAPGAAASSFTELKRVDGGEWHVEEGSRRVMKMWENW